MENCILCLLLVFVKEVRQSAFNKFVKICLLSGDIEPGEKSELGKVGISAFISKPIERTKLLSVVQKMLR